jgi:hypothetical protein
MVSADAATANLAEAVQRAARDLPAGYRVEVEVECGAATVRLHYPCGAYAVMDYEGDLPAEVLAAIDTAQEDAARVGEPSGGSSGEAR